MNELTKKIYSNQRLTPEEAVTLFDWNLIELGRAADYRRKLATPGPEVGFVLDRIINYTNICQAGCLFCAYHARGGIVAPYELSIDEILRKVEELVAAGGTQVMLQGGLHPHYTLDTYTSLLRIIKKRYPEIYLHSFSPAEVVNIALNANMTFHRVISALKEAGLDSMPGASDLLVDRIRQKVSPNKMTTAQWQEVMRALQRNGMHSTATMTYGMGETPQERIQHLAVIRQTQDETGILKAFIPWSFSPHGTRMEEVIPATGMDYLKIVAIARIFLDNIQYIQAGWLTEGLDLAQVALTMGANDMGGILTEEVVVKATGIQTETTLQQMVQIIKNAGRTPVQRDSLYRVIRSYH